MFELTERKNFMNQLKLIAPCILVMLLTACLDNKAPVGGKSCNCYVNSDCALPLVCHTGIDCTEGLHSTKAQPQEGIFESTINNIGLCLEFGPHAPWPSGTELESVVGNYLMSLELSANTGARKANEDLVKKALSHDFNSEQHRAIISFVTLIAMHALGPAPGVDRGYLHRPGYYLPATQQELDERLEEPTVSSTVRELGSVLDVDESTLAGFTYISNAVVAEISDPQVGVFRQQMKTLRKTVPDYKPFDACQYPHPQEHGHEFAFEDDIECLTIQIEDALHLFLQIDTAQ